MIFMEGHEPIDVFSLTAQLKSDGKLKSGGSGYLSDLLNVVPTSAHASGMAVLFRKIAQAIAYRSRSKNYRVCV
jgi:replicative DNA helicase